MSSNYVLPLLSSHSQPRHVLTGDRELQHENKALSGQDGNVLAAPWTEVYSVRAERDLRKALLKSQFEKKQSSSRYEAKSFVEQRRPTLAQLAVSRQAKEAKELKSQHEIAAVMEQSAAVKQQSDALQGKVATIQSTLDKLLSMLEGKIAVSDPKPSVDTNDGSPVSKFELMESPPKASYKEALERSSPPTSQTSSASASSPSTSAGSSPIISAANSPIAGSPIADKAAADKAAADKAAAAAVTAKKVISHPSPPLTAPPSRDNLGNKTRKFTQSISTSVKVTATDEKVLSKETTSMPKVAESFIYPRPASPSVLTYRSGVLNDSGVVSSVYGPPDSSGGVSDDCGGVTKVGNPVGSDGAPGGPGQVPETSLPYDGSNRASEGEQLWSPDPPNPSAGEVFSTIPATRTATDNQLLKFANLQVVWYTSAITTILITFDYLQRLQRDMVVSFQQISMEVLRSMDCSISSHRTSGYTSQNAAA